MLGWLRQGICQLRVETLLMLGREELDHASHQGPSLRPPLIWRELEADDRRLKRATKVQSDQGWWTLRSGTYIFTRASASQRPTSGGLFPLS
ncbi:hypothetical protein HYQ46_010795 [Verticillium longisporum]|nr:hypothetical protein HYQ46_010795 [Verticillium longisporum]